jgi:hypothetical protein
MIEPENASSEDENGEESKGDALGALKFAGALIVGLLAIVGLSFTDILKPKKKPVSKETESEGDEVADYEETYLDGDITESDYQNVPSK